MLSVSPGTAGSSLPLVISPEAREPELAPLAQTQKHDIEAALRIHGALLFRGFDVASPERFEQVAAALCGSLLAKNTEHVPIQGHVQTPVTYSAKHKLLWHHENSFKWVWPRKLLFGCDTPATSGGESLLVDARKVFQTLDTELRDEWLQKKIMYVRNFASGIGLSWQQVFDTTDPRVVEKLCAEEKIEIHWPSNDQLTTRSVRPAAIRHPHTGEWCWTNQVSHWHISCLDPRTRTSLASLMAEHDFPRNCYFGDGSKIPGADIQKVLEVYRALEVPVRLERGDVLLIDNVLVAHARNPYVGTRKIFVALGDPAPLSDPIYTSHTSHNASSATTENCAISLIQ